MELDYGVIAFFIIVIVAGVALFYIYYKIARDILDTISIYIRKRNFFISFTNLMKINPNFQDTIDLIKTTTFIDDTHPKFSKRFEILMEDYKKILIDNKTRYLTLPTDRDTVIQWLDIINDFKTQLNVRYPFRGLELEEITIFQDTHDYINTTLPGENPQKMILNRKLKEIAELVSVKNRELNNSKTKVQYAYYATIIGVILAIISVIFGIMQIIA